MNSSENVISFLPSLGLQQEEATQQLDDKHVLCFHNKICKIVGENPNSIKDDDHKVSAHLTEGDGDVKEVSISICLFIRPSSYWLLSDTLVFVKSLHQFTMHMTSNQVLNLHLLFNQVKYVESKEEKKETHSPKVDKKLLKSEEDENKDSNRGQADPIVQKKKGPSPKIDDLPKTDMADFEAQKKKGSSSKIDDLPKTDMADSVVQKKKGFSPKVDDLPKADMADPVVQKKKGSSSKIDDLPKGDVADIVKGVKSNARNTPKHRSSQDSGVDGKEHTVTQQKMAEVKHTNEVETDADPNNNMVQQNTKHQKTEDTERDNSSHLGNNDGESERHMKAKSTTTEVILPIKGSNRGGKSTVIQTKDEGSNTTPVEVEVEVEKQERKHSKGDSMKSNDESKSPDDGKSINSAEGAKVSVADDGLVHKHLKVLKYVFVYNFLFLRGASS